MSPIVQSTRPQFPAELGPEYEVHIGQNVPDPIAVPWSGPRSRRRGGKLLALYALAGFAIFTFLTSGVGLPT